MVKVKQSISGVLLIVVTVLVLLPILLVIVNSFRTNHSLAVSPIGLPTSLDLSNFGYVITHMNFFRGVGISTLITASSVALILLIGSAASWAIARTTRRWASGVYRLFIAGLTIPVFVMATPLYLEALQLGLLNNLVAVILVYTAFNMPFAVFFYTSFLRSVPQELEEAAAIDGCGPLRTYWHIILPMLRPSSAAMAVFIAISIWNDVTVPLLLLDSQDVQPLTLSIYSFVGTEGGIQQSQLFPAVLLATLPLFILFLVFQRYIVAGISAGVGK
ncbi:MAG TPA: carbohydrate ABC transporter permease [Galbitalea sp.]|jgi:raffinose/stachyose/melibiose transport system permease protein|nr:carbohydrate ABC transporter permease [Galbitalea sp.]